MCRVLTGLITLVALSACTGEESLPVSQAQSIATETTAPVATPTALATPPPAATAEPPPTETGVPEPGYDDEGTPPTLVVFAPNGKIELEPVTFCGPGAACEAGARPDPLPDVGSFDQPIRFSLPRGWTTLWATIQRPDRSFAGSALITAVEPGVWDIVLADAAGPKTVILEAHGPGGAEFVFDAEFTVDSPAPPPLVDFLGPHSGPDGELRTHRLGVIIVQLGDDSDPSGTITVTAANGATSPEIELDASNSGGVGDGIIAMNSSREDALAALELGPPPYQYDLTVRIGDRVHKSTFVFPNPIDENLETLHPIFDPPLPRER